MDMWKELFTSKKFVMACVGVAIPAANAAFGWSLAVDTVMMMVGPVMAYVAGQGLADFGKNSQ